LCTVCENEMCMQHDRPSVVQHNRPSVIQHDRPSVGRDIVGKSRKRSTLKLLPKKTRSSDTLLLLLGITALLGVLGVFSSEHPCDTLRCRAERTRGDGPDALSDDSTANDGVSVSDHDTKYTPLTTTRSKY